MKIPITEGERIRAIQIYRSARVGPRNYAKLIEKSENYEEAWENLCQAYVAQKLNHKLLCSFDDAKLELDRGEEYGSKLVFLGDETFPKLLKTVDSAPPFIWTKGNFDLLSLKQIAIVGARNATIEGVRNARGLARELGQHGIVTTSGLARGVDAAAHEGALASGTIGVVAGGLDVPYPRSNQQLQQQIAERGLLVSEMPFGQQPQASNFPQRNRIVAGLSQATLVVEATQRSGTLITARICNELGREVMAIPGSPFNPTADGPNLLIREGATLIRNIDDILEVLNPLASTREHELTPSSKPKPVSTSAPSFIQRGLDEINGKTIRTIDDRVTQV